MWLLMKNTLVSGNVGGIVGYHHFAPVSVSHFAPDGINA
jgi:hypothetical protein